MATDFGAYSRLLRVPGSVPFVVAGVLSRYPRSTLSLGVILLVSAGAGSFAAAGIATAVLVSGMAVSAPFWSTRMDRHGQRPVLLAALACLVASVSVLLVLVAVDAPLLAWLAAALAMGLSTPDIAAAVRARWSALVRGDDLATAFAVETVGDQMVFVTGPPLVTILAASLNPAAGIVVSLVVGVGGGAWLAAQTSTEPPIVPRASRSRRILPPAGVVPVSIACIGLGAMFGSFDVSVVAWAEALGAAWLAGIALAVTSVGVAAGSILVGARVWRTGPQRRFIGFAAVGTVIAAALPVAADRGWLLGLVPLFGLVVSPVMVSAITLAAARAPRDRVTESLAYPTAGMSVGVPIGGAVAGFALDAQGPAAGLIITAVALAAALVVAAAGEGFVWLRRRADAGAADREGRSRT